MTSGVTVPTQAESNLIIEPFVDADRAAAFLGITRRRVLELARAGEIPGYPVREAKRKTWRFRLSKLAQTIAAKGSTFQIQPSYYQKRQSLATESED